MKVDHLRLFLAIPLLFLCSGAAHGGDDASESAVLKELMRRLDSLEEQNKELRQKLEKSGEAEPAGDELKEQIRVLQKRLDAFEKAGMVRPPDPKDESLFPPHADPLPKDGKTFADFVTGVVDKRLQSEAQKKLEAEKEAARKKEEEARKKDAQGYVVGTNKSMTANWNHGLQLTSEDDAFRMHMGGRVDWDNVWYQPPDKGMRFGNDNNITLQDGSAFRRMRLRADGRIYDWIDFVFEVNFANIQDFSNQTQEIVVGSVGITDSNLTFREIPFFGNVRVGHFLPPISLEHMTSSNFTYYMERSPQFDAFINRFDYASGINFFDTYLNDRVTFASALVRTGSRTINPFGAGAGDGEYGFVLRSTGLPIFKDEGRKLVHFGMAIMQRTLDNHGTSPGARALVRAGASRAELPNVIQTGSWFSPDGEWYLNPEFAMVMGRFSLSGEYLWTFAPSSYTKQNAAGAVSDPRGPVNFYGFYVESGYFLTQGDYRRYNRKAGSWDRTTPLENAWLMRGKNRNTTVGRGAVQLLARFSYLDLHSGNPVLSPSQGARAGIEKDVTLGMAWYLNPQSNVQVNYVHTQIDSVLPSARGSFDGLGLRFHYDF